jgi:hypothetical protein
MPQGLLCQFVYQIRSQAFAPAGLRPDPPIYTFCIAGIIGIAHYTCPFVQKLLMKENFKRNPETLKERDIPLSSVSSSQKSMLVSYTVFFWIHKECNNMLGPFQ